MMDWKSWDSSDRTEINEIQKDQDLVGRILLPFAADDDQRKELFTMVLDMIDEVTTTEDRIEVMYGSNFFTIRRVH